MKKKSGEEKKRKRKRENKREKKGEEQDETESEPACSNGLKAALRIPPSHGIAS
jgi:hypothetical protein